MKESWQFRRRVGNEDALSSFPTCRVIVDPASMADFAILKLNDVDVSCLFFLNVFSQDG
jgi:hypothetical protein